LGGEISSESEPKSTEKHSPVPMNECHTVNERRTKTAVQSGDESTKDGEEDGTNMKMIAKYEKRVFHGESPSEQ